MASVPAQTRASRTAHSLHSSEVVQLFDVNPATGLSTAQSATQLRLYGPNEIPPVVGKSMVKLILEQFEDLLVLILLAAAVVSFLLALFEDRAEDENAWTAFVEPAVILIILIVNTTVGVVQESNAKTAIKKLRQSEAREATVIREGHARTIHAVEVVPGDIIVVQEGDKISADARILHVSSAFLSIDESMLTGESEATSKHSEAIDKANAVNQDKRNVLFSGALVVKGKATGVVVATGAHTEMGAIAHALGAENEQKTPLQAKLEQLSKVIAGICITVWLIGIGVLKGAIY